MNLTKSIEKANERAVEFFRHLHAHPELSEKEENTADFICSILNELQIPCRRSRTDCSVTGFIAGADSGKTDKTADGGAASDICIGIRADIDALPVCENTGLSYQSQNPGVMHACGHDMHTAILLGAAIVLKELADAGKLAGSVKLLFQPAEESIGGADAMIKAGAMENPKVNKTIGLHVNPSEETGTATFCSGPMNAAVDDFSCRIQGRQAHGAKPEEGVDSIVAAADIIMRLQTVVSRMTAPTNPVVITIGQIHAGTAPNIIPDSVTLGGTLRALNNETLDFLRCKTEETAKSTAAFYGAEAEFLWMNTPFPPLINDAEVTEILEKAAESCPHIHTVKHLARPDMGADDYAFFTQAAPGSYFTLGCTKKGETGYPLHNEKFAADPAAILAGIEIEVCGVLKLLEESSAK